MSFSGFGNLEFVQAFSRYGSSARYGGDAAFRIAGNDALVSFSGFEKLRVIRGATNGVSARFIVEDNPALVSIPEFGQLTFISGVTSSPRTTLSISDNASLTSVSGFGQLVGVKGEGDGLVMFSNNASLESISGFESLTFTEPGDPDSFYSAALTISDNPSLTSVSGFAPFAASEAPYAKITAEINNNTVFNCSMPPQSDLPFLPVDESTGNLVNCPTE